jgi:endonuclease YncB( thermonuclease family)
MRFRTGLVVFLGLIAVSGLSLWLMTVEPPPPPPAATATAPPLPAPAAPVVEVPVTEPPVAEPSAPVPPAAPELPALPELKLAEHPIHLVPQEPGPPPPTSGQPLDRQGAAHSPGQSDEVTFGAHPLAPAAPPRQFSGTATATGAVELKVDATEVALFGIKRAGERDRCGSAPGSDCAAAARLALAQRVSAVGKVSCRIPNPRPGVTAYAICLDADGVDLSGFLIAQGLALADTGQSYDYVGAEGIARNLKRGLWQFR